MSKKRENKPEPLSPDALARYEEFWALMEPSARILAERIVNLTELAGGRSAAAAAMGVGSTTLDNYRQGKTQPRFLEALRLVRAAGRTIDYLLAGTEFADLVPSSNSSSHTDVEAEAELDFIEQRLGQEPSFPLDDETRSELEVLRGVLEEFAEEETLPDRQRARADLLLRLAFSDEAATQRHQLRAQKRRTEIQRAELALQDAFSIVGWKPSEATYQTLLSIALEYRIEGAPLLILLREMRRLEQHGHQGGGNGGG